MEISSDDISPMTATEFQAIVVDWISTARDPRYKRLAEVNFVDDGAGKPVGINEHIGRRPIAAFGNSDGDLEMLQWTTMAGGRRLGLIVHHTDEVREYAYDRDTSVGRLDKALDAAALNRWTVVDMKNDWKRIFAFE